MQRLLWKVIASYLLFCTPAAWAQGSASTQLPYRLLTAHAGYIFKGTVISVQHSQPAGGIAAVQVDFRVDQGVRNAVSGKTLTIREWAGLWEAGERYRVGERLILFLYPKSGLGLTSPVGGPMGHLNVDERDQISLPQSWRFAPNRESLPSARQSTSHSVGSHDFLRLIARMAEE